MEEDHVNFVTLLPKRKRMRQFVVDHSQSKIQLLLLLDLLFSLLCFGYDLVLMLLNFSDASLRWPHAVRATGDCSRTAYYALVLFAGQKWKTFRAYATLPVFLFYSVMVTELYCYTEADSQNVIRIRYLFIL